MRWTLISVKSLVHNSWDMTTVDTNDSLYRYHICAFAWSIKCWYISLRWHQDTLIEHSFFYDYKTYLYGLKWPLNKILLVLNLAFVIASYRMEMLYFRTDEWFILISILPRNLFFPVTFFFLPIHHYHLH